MRLKWKVIIVKGSSNELEKALNSGWALHNIVPGGTGSVVYTLKKNG